MKSKCAAVMVVAMVLVMAFAFVRMQHADSGTVKAQPGEEISRHRHARFPITPDEHCFDLAGAKHKPKGTP